jgi:hypothetical protein
VEGSKVFREFPITPGRIEGLGRRSKPVIADYVPVVDRFVVTGATWPPQKDGQAAREWFDVVRYRRAERAPQDGRHRDFPPTRGKALGVPSAWEGLQVSVQTKRERRLGRTSGLLPQCVGVVAKTNRKLNSAGCPDEAFARMYLAGEFTTTYFAGELGRTSLENSLRRTSLEN